MCAGPCTLAGPSAVFIDPSVEKWLVARTGSNEVTHLVHAPSNPMGWTAGKWMEWYPDVLTDGVSSPPLNRSLTGSRAG